MKPLCMKTLKVSKHYQGRGNFNRNYGGGYGHVGVVLSATLNSITIIEQNWLGGAY